MGSILISLPKREDSENIARIIRKKVSIYEVVICTSPSEILRAAGERDRVAVICGSNIRGMSYMELFDYLPTDATMIILTKDATIELTAARMLRMILPLKVRELLSGIETSLSDNQRQKKRYAKIPVKRTPQEQYVIDEAKKSLMEKKVLSEQEAFRYLQKSSMNSGRTLLETAQMVLLLSDGWNT